jgi:hypothetical protein
MPSSSAPALAMPPPHIESFFDLYSKKSSDPFDRDYHALMLEFAEFPNELSARDMFNMVKQNEGPVGAYIGLFTHPEHEAGRSMVVHGVKKYVRQLGDRATWHDRTFAFIGDVIEGDIQTVELTQDMFRRTKDDTCTQVYGTKAAINQAWTNRPDAELLGPVAAAEPGSSAIMTRHLMLVPPCYVPIVINRNLSPRQLWDELASTIFDNGDKNTCEPLLHWILLAGSRHEASSPSPVLRAAIVPPLMDAVLSRHRKEILRRLLPDLDPARPSADPNAIRMTNYLGQVVAEQQATRADQRARSDAARAPRLPSSYFPEASCARLMFLCGVAEESNLPELWRLLASAGRRDRLAIDQAIQATADRKGMSNRGPIITPDFARRIAQLSFAGHNMDNLGEGLQPFAMVVVDYRSIQARTTMDHARRTAEDYDLITAGETNTSLTDARSLRDTNVIHIDFDSVHAEARVDAALITLDAILGDDH